tara:strand:+ start:697 stop:2043 length:1347 start_codon:yes stop_codon:yes gene_type:complete
VGLIANKNIVKSKGVDMKLPFENSEYLERQARLFSEMPENTTLIIPTNDKKIRSNDVVYPFRPNSYMLYMCGWKEEGVFVASNVDGEWGTTLFVNPRDTETEIWEGIRIGPEGAVNWPVTDTDSLENFESKIRDLFGRTQKVFCIGGVSQRVDELLAGVAEIGDPRIILDRMRRIKSKREIEHMREAARIGSEAHIHAIMTTLPGFGEWEIQSAVEGYFMKSNSNWSFPSIVGGGDNGTVLHYNLNECIVNDGDLVLVDAGCEVHGYASDITRTWPVNGKFSDSQREIYELVLKAEIAGIEACQPGAPWVNFHRAASKVIAEGLIDLNVLNCSLDDALGHPDEFDGQFRNFFMHGSGHFLGLDVHDVGGGRKGDKEPGPLLEAGMVLTVEPGLYFAKWRTDIEIPPRYEGIGVRIEDDVLITDDGPEVLTAGCPKTVDEIERLVGTGA